MLRVRAAAALLTNSSWASWSSTERDDRVPESSRGGAERYACRRHRRGQHRASARRGATGTARGRLVELHGPPRVALQLVAEPMPSGCAVATIEDISERNANRTDAHRLRREHLPRTQDPGRSDRRARRGADRGDGSDVDRSQSPAGWSTEAHRAVGTIDDLLELSPDRVGSASGRGRRPRRCRRCRHRAWACGRRSEGGGGRRPSTVPRACGCAPTGASSSRRSATSSRTPSSTATRWVGPGANPCQRTLRSK